MARIGIDPRFFKNAVLDYADPVWAFVREVMQNAMDSDGCSKIEVTITTDQVENDQIAVRVVDNGEGMDRATLENKLLSLGGTGKEFRDGKVGGFGKAKEVLFFAQARYTIRTREWHVSGVGGEYSLKKVDSHFAGCDVQVVWCHGSSVEKFLAAFKRFVELSGWSGKVELNLAVLKERLRPRSLRRTMEFGAVYRTTILSHLLVVRIHGVPMFTQWIDYPSCVVVELKDGASASNFLTANRDGLRYPYSNQLSALVVELCGNKRSALRCPVTEYRRYSTGRKIKVTTSTPMPIREIPVFTQQVSDEEEPSMVALAQAAQLKSELGIVSVAAWGSVGQQVSTDRSEQAPAQFDYDFVLKNNTGMTIPRQFIPRTFSPYSRRLLRLWVQALIAVHRILRHEDEFSVGFIFDTDREAEHENTPSGRTYYLNPAVVLYGKRTRFGRRFKTSEHGRVLALAAHEVVHGLGYSAHDEDYAGRLTDAFAALLVGYRVCVSRRMRVERRRYAESATVRMLRVDEGGTGKRAKIFDLLYEGMTVAEFRAALLQSGLSRSPFKHLNVFRERGLISIEP